MLGVIFSWAAQLAINGNCSRAQGRDEKLSRGRGGRTQPQWVGGTGRGLAAPQVPPAREMSVCLSPWEVWLVGRDGWPLELLLAARPPFSPVKPSQGCAAPQRRGEGAGAGPAPGGGDSAEEPVCGPAPASQKLLEPPSPTHPPPRPPCGPRARRHGREPPAPNWGEATPAPGGVGPWGPWGSRG